MNKGALIYWGWIAVRLLVVAAFIAWLIFGWPDLGESPEVPDSHLFNH